jgi:flagellar motility protein MotE (MotC chaperone)
MKKILLIVGPLLLIGSVVGLGVMGIIPIPGLSPAKKKNHAAALYTEQKEMPVVKKEPPKTEPEKPAGPNLEKGRQELAKVWNELEPAAIVAIVDKWTDEDVAQQLRYLDTEKSAAVLALLKPERASKVSKVLQILGGGGKTA